MPKKEEKDKPEIKVDLGLLGLGTVFKGIGNLVDLLSEMVEKGEGEFHRTKEFTGQGRLKDLRGVYGISVKIGLGGPQVETFGNIRETEKGPVVEEVREPMIDLFEEEQHLQIIAELPGVDEKDIQVEVRGDILTIQAEGQKHKYSKELLLPAKVKETPLSRTYRNGILEIRLAKEASQTPH